MVTSDNEKVTITFTESIQSIDTMFSNATLQWGATSFKEWLEGYEATRFTQISERLALITSAYNMPFVKIWLKFHTKVGKIKNI